MSLNICCRGGEKGMRKLKKYQSTIVQWLGLILVVLIFGIWSEGNLFSRYNINTMLETVTPLLVVCVGMAFIFAHGGMDISSGAVIAAASLAAVQLMNRTDSLVLGILAAMAISVVCYVINVIVTNKFGLMATITSLAIMFSARGLVTYICQLMPNESISISNVSVELFKKNHVFMVVVMVLTVLILGVIFNYTEIGKGAKAIGDNELAAEQNGIPVNRTKIICYVIAGICVGLASVFKLSAVGMVQSTTGNGMEMDVLVVVVLGGMALSGGAGTRMSSAVVGAFTYVILIKGLTIIGMNPNVVLLVKAIIFLVIIFVTAPRSRMKTMPK